MPWVRFDDTFPINRKVEALTDQGFRLHVSAIFWCARNLTDGFVPEIDLELVTARVKKHRKLAEELVSRGLWITRVDGWEIKDYLKFQPSKEKVLADRESAAGRQRNWRETRKTGRNAGSNGVTNGVSNTTPPRPAPLPSGERGGRGKSRRLSVVHTWCGRCTEDTRQLELEDGRLARCPDCHPLRSVS
jgi:hypothetical protein